MVLATIRVHVAILAFKHDFVELVLGPRRENGIKDGPTWDVKQHGVGPVIVVLEFLRILVNAHVPIREDTLHIVYEVLVDHPCDVHVLRGNVAGLQAFFSIS